MNLVKPYLVGLFGGTFDPIHHGHLHAIHESYKALSLNELRVIPAATPPHRQEPQSMAFHRANMVRAALEDFPPQIYCDDCEIKRPGPSYSIDTINYLKQELIGATLCLIIGMDSFLSFHTWFRFQEIVNKVNLIVLHRPRYTNPLLIGPMEFLIKNKLESPKDLRLFSHGKILFLSIAALDISSTDIRQNFRTGILPDSFIPKAVSNYIVQNNLYFSQEKL